jgi:hypothetical protein
MLSGGDLNVNLCRCAPQIDHTAPAVHGRDLRRLLAMAADESPISTAAPAAIRLRLKSIRLPLWFPGASGSGVRQHSAGIAAPLPLIDVGASQSWYGSVHPEGDVLRAGLDTYDFGALLNNCSCWKTAMQATKL